MHIDANLALIIWAVLVIPALALVLYVTVWVAKKVGHWLAHKH